MADRAPRSSSFRTPKQTQNRRRAHVRTDSVDRRPLTGPQSEPKKKRKIEMYAQAMSGRDPIEMASGVPDSESRPRAHWGSLSRDHIIAVALATIENGQYESMTIRSLAADIGVAPMALYRHIRDRDDLLDEVTDQLLAQNWRPSANPDMWSEWIREAAMRFRRLLVSQPAVLHVYLSHPVATPAALDRMQSMLNVLHGAGLDPPAAERLYATIHTYTIGFAALEASRSQWKSTNQSEDAMMKRLATFTTTEQFVAGIELLLHGVEHSA